MGTDSPKLLQPGETFWPSKLIDWIKDIGCNSDGKENYNLP